MANWVNWVVLTGGRTIYASWKSDDESRDWGCPGTDSKLVFWVESLCENIARAISDSIISLISFCIWC